MTVLTLQAKDLEVGARIDGQVVPAIRALSFDLAPGEILGLVGESGAGKSMIGRSIAKLLPPGFEITAGSLLFEGERLPQMPPARRRALLGRAIAFIPQQPMTALNPVMTIGAQFIWRDLAKITARAGASGQSPRSRQQGCRDPPTFSPSTRINCRAACVSAC